MSRPTELLVSVLENIFSCPTSYLAHVQERVLEALKGHQVAQCWDWSRFCCAALSWPPILVFCPFGITFVFLLLPHWCFRFHLYPQKGVLNLSDVFRAGFSRVSLCHSSPSSDSFCEQARGISSAEAPIEPSGVICPSLGVADLTLWEELEVSQSNWRQLH